MNYAGDIDCKACWQVLQDNSSAVLVDVRTVPEWNFVGVPVLDAIGKKLITVEWQKFPTMEVNSQFVTDVTARIDEMGLDKQSEVFCLCRSGVRSIAAAQVLTSHGFSKAFNVLGGFEGDKDQNGHRASVAGWKFDGLPWVQ